MKNKRTLNAWVNFIGKIIPFLVNLGWKYSVHQNTLKYFLAEFLA